MLWKNQMLSDESDLVRVTGITNCKSSNHRTTNNFFLVLSY